MDISLEYYKVFYYVAKYKKISLAAEKLYVSQPAVTQTIQKLEDALGDALFIRGKKGLELTKSGQTLYDFIGDSISLLDNVNERFSKFEKLEEGIIRIRSGSHITNLILCNAIEKFVKDYPNIKIEIVSDAPKKSEMMIANGEIDILATSFPYELEHKNLKKIEIMDSEYIFVMSKKYQEENNVKIEKVEDINNYSFIAPVSESARWKILSENFDNKIKNFHMEISNEQIKNDFVMKDLGIGFAFKEEVKKELKSGKLVEIKLKEGKIKGKIGIITADDKFMSYATKKFIEYVIEENK